MKKIGIISDLTYYRHPLFRNYFFALENIFGWARIVQGAKDLEGLDILFIGDDHFYNHKPIYRYCEFIDKCNANKIKVVVFTVEKILNSFFPWNKENQSMLRAFNELYQYMIDVDDCIAFGKKLNRVLMSKHYKNSIKLEKEKIDKVVFIGRTDCLAGSYNERIGILEKIKEIIPIEIIPPTMSTWEEYMQNIGKYRFVLSPHGNSNAFPMRFYEILLVKSIPIHQIRENTFQLYDIEYKFDDCIYFIEPEELPDKIKNFELQKSYNEFWLEDYLKKILTEDGLL